LKSNKLKVVKKNAAFVHIFSFFSNLKTKEKSNFVGKFQIDTRL